MAKSGNPRSKEAAGSPPQSPVKIQNPYWKPLACTFICWARMFPPTLMSWLPRTISNESEMEKTLVPPWNGAYPRSPSDQYPLNSVDVNPQLMPPRLAPGMPSFCASQVPLPKDVISLKILLKPILI